MPPKHTRSKSSPSTPSNGSVKKWAQNFASIWFKKEEDTNPDSWFDPEDLTELKREWIDKQAAETKELSWPPHIFDSFFVVGISPDTNVVAVSQQLAGKEQTAGQSSTCADDTQQEPTLEPRVLFQYPPRNASSISEQELISLCFPAKPRVERLKRSPSFSALNNILYDKHQIKDSDCSVFMLKVGENLPVYGICCYVKEFVHKAPYIAKHAFPNCTLPSHQCLAATQRCYCIISHYPFFELHFQVISVLLNMERLNRTMEYEAERVHTCTVENVQLEGVCSSCFHIMQDITPFVSQPVTPTGEGTSIHCTVCKKPLRTACPAILEQTRVGESTLSSPSYRATADYRTPSSSKPNERMTIIAPKHYRTFMTNSDHMTLISSASSIPSGFFAAPASGGSTNQTSSPKANRQPSLMQKMFDAFSTSAHKDQAMLSPPERRSDCDVDSRVEMGTSGRLQDGWDAVPGLQQQNCSLLQQTTQQVCLPQARTDQEDPCKVYPFQVAASALCTLDATCTGSHAPAQQAIVQGGSTSKSGVESADDSSDSVSFLTVSEPMSDNEAKENSAEADWTDDTQPSDASGFELSKEIGCHAVSQDCCLADAASPIENPLSASWPLSDISCEGPWHQRKLKVQQEVQLMHIECQEHQHQTGTLSHRQNGSVSSMQCDDNQEQLPSQNQLLDSEGMMQETVPKVLEGEHEEQELEAGPSTGMQTNCEEGKEDIVTGSVNSTASVSGNDQPRVSTVSSFGTSDQSEAPDLMRASSSSFTEGVQVTGLSARILRRQSSDHLPGMRSLSKLLYTTPQVVLERYYGSRIPLPGEPFVIAFGTMSLVEYQRPLMGRYPLQGSMKQLLSYAEAELAQSLSSWAVASLSRSLSLEVVLLLLTAALLEKQIVVWSHNMSALTAAVLSLLALLRPFCWQSLMLPITPLSMMGFLEAPVPFILGVYAAPGEPQIRVDDDVVFLDMSKNEVKNAADLPALPNSKKLLAQLQPHHTFMRGHAAEAFRRPVFQLEEEEKDATMYFLEGVRDFLQTLCGDLRPHTIINVGMKKKTGYLMKESLIASFQPKDRPFMKQFTSTQMFSVYSDTVINGFCDE